MSTYALSIWMIYFIRLPFCATNVKLHNIVFHFMLPCFIYILHYLMPYTFASFIIYTLFVCNWTYFWVLKMNSNIFLVAETSLSILWQATSLRLWAHFQPLPPCRYPNHSHFVLILLHFIDFILNWYVYVCAGICKTTSLQALLTFLLICLWIVCASLLYRRINILYYVSIRNQLSFFSQIIHRNVENNNFTGWIPERLKNIDLQ